jgi:hypothetical protein
MTMKLFFQSMRLTAVLCIVVTLFSGCAHRVDTTTEQQQRIALLEQSLQQLSPQAPRAAAQRIAGMAVEKAADLREQYAVELTPWMHNVEVNWGTKPRGHCYHYAIDMGATLRPELAPYWQLYFVQAKPGSVLEHNAVVITQKHQPWETGIVLDAWRNAGVLYFGPVLADKYPWQLSTKRH